ncbi:murein hydrolase activator EnvC family protein [Geomesophilobacter sediminis]|uniref:murein hydrolase activator EnvC family protein n=1 Tax=Geomesophilobacter sediminis TaxID=2798584 RepID=UPI002E2D345D|nr:peptidoglycan DD-metalloendopeptidase family protein [Geomesophilobacter sediminis]
MQRITAVALLVLLAPLPALAGAKEDLQGVKKEINEKNRLLTKTKKVETQVSGEIEVMGRSLKEKQAALASLGRDLASVEQGIGRTMGEIDRVSREAEKKRAQINRRVVAAYKGGEVGNLRAYFSSESLPQMSENLRYMRSVVENDRKLFTQYRADLDQLKVLKASLEKDAQKKEGIRRNIEAKKREIEQEKSKKSTYLVKVRQDKQQYQASIKELQANARRLQTMVQKLEARARRASVPKTPKGRLAKHTPQPTRPGLNEPPTVQVPDQGLGGQKGRLSLPVRGNVVDRFGRHKHPTFESFTVSNGISIAAPAGAPIHAIYDGEVIFANYFKGYGNMVIIDHGGGFFSLYAHAASIAKRVGAKVAKNDVVASVGDLDSSKGPILYFEIRYQGKPVDPSPWFR